MDIILQHKIAHKRDMRMRSNKCEKREEEREVL